MTVEVLGILLHFSLKNVILALILTTIIAYPILKYRYIAVYKGDSLANGTLITFYANLAVYRKHFLHYDPLRHRDLYLSFKELQGILDLHLMQNEHYRNQFQSLLRHYSKEMYEVSQWFDYLRRNKIKETEIVLDHIGVILSNMRDEFKSQLNFHYKRSA